MGRDVNVVQQQLNCTHATYSRFLRFRLLGCDDGVPRPVLVDVDLGTTYTSLFLLYNLLVESDHLGFFLHFTSCFDGGLLILGANGISWLGSFHFLVKRPNAV